MVWSVPLYCIYTAKQDKGQGTTIRRVARTIRTRGTVHIFWQAWHPKKTAVPTQLIYYFPSSFHSTALFRHKYYLASSLYTTAYSTNPAYLIGS